MLPDSYVEQNADYGWAATIDTAQGSTTDVAILMARPGLDREHFYVGMTRGRAENHVYVAPDPADDVDHYRPNRDDDPSVGARRVLTAALARSGTQQAAHTVAQNAADQAVEQDPARVPLPDSERSRIEVAYAARRLDADRLRQDLRWHDHDVARYEKEHQEIPQWRPRERRHAERFLADVRARRDADRSSLDRFDGELADMQATLARPRPAPPPPRHTTILGPERWQPPEPRLRREDRVRRRSGSTPPTPQLERPAYVYDDHDELHRALTRQDDRYPGRSL
jgi:hypothetical protein